jgi:hypothetical protein
MSAADKQDLIWEQRWIGRPADTHYSADGASPLLRNNDTNRLATHAVIGEPSESTSDNGGADSITTRALAVVGVLALTAAAAYGTKKLWDLAKSKRNASTEEASEDEDVERTVEATIDEQDALIDEVSALIEATNAQPISTANGGPADLGANDSTVENRERRKVLRRR